MTALLEIENLQTQFFTSAGTVRAVDGISYGVEAGETVALVGESGCGKSVSALSILRLIPNPPGRIVGGSIRFKGTDLLQLSDAGIRAVRGRRIAMVFQGGALFDSMTVGENVAFGLREHGWAGGTERLVARVAEVLDLVGLDGSEALMPASLSGGMRKRVAFARALALGPEAVLYDEPTTGLHPVDIQVLLQCLDQLIDQGGSVIVIEHNLDVIKTADHIIDLGPEGGDKGGEIVSQGTPEEVANDPLSYTGQALHPVLFRR